jgi:hypothetical protein
LGFGFGALGQLLLEQHLRQRLPTALRGKVMRRSNAAGVSCLPSRSARKTFKPSSVNGTAPGRSVTKALAASPR